MKQWFWGEEKLTNSFDFDIVVVDFSMAEELSDEADHIISIWDNGTYAEEKFDWIKNHKSKLVLEFDDVDEECYDFSPPKPHHISKLIDFCKDKTGKIIIHCMAGIRRSSAAAWIFLCLNMHPLDARDELQNILNKTKQRKWRYLHANPNRLMIQYADEILDLNDELISAWHEKNTFA